MTPVESCRACGRLFHFLARGYCTDCIDERERRYHEVREWLLDNRGASILDASAATGVDEQMIMAFVREGRLEVVPTDPDADSVREDEALKARLRRDLAARDAGGPPAPPAGARPPVAPSAPAPAGRPHGMRTRTS